MNPPRETEALALIPTYPEPQRCPHKMRAWETRRQKYGPTGHERHRHKGGRPRLRRLGGWCGHQHKLTAENAIVRGNGFISCRICRKLRGIRRRERAKLVAKLEGTLPALRRRLLARHPDHGGTARDLDDLLKLYRRVKRIVGEEGQGTI